MRRAPLFYFFLINAVLLPIAFGGALIGTALLAPLDLPAAAYPKYRFVDPNTTGVASNYGQNDQLVYDLPIQFTIHDAYKRREIPWWDPYCFAGRPLLADAHISGTDPVRILMYLLLPFEAAYNWTRLLHYLLGGLGFLLLLSHLGFKHSTSIILAITAEFSGYNSHFFGYPWLQASFLYYPFLWVVWDLAVEDLKWWHLPAGTFLAAGIFYAGNLQSHTYVFLFAVAFTIGYGGLSWARWKRLFPSTGATLFLGGCLAAPVLLNQVEFFHLGARTVAPARNPVAWLCGLATFSSVFPWALGAPGTLDVRSFFFRNAGLGQNYGLGYHTYLGSAGFFLAVLAAFKATPSKRLPAVRTAVILLVIFLVILSTPLITVFYSRSAGLAIFALTILIAEGVELVFAREEKLNSWGWTVGGFAVLVLLAVNVGALLIYPRLVPRIQGMLEKRETAMEFKMGTQMRKAQIEKFPKAISFKNPAPALAFLSLVILAGVLLQPRWRKRPFAREALLVINFLPPFLFLCQLGLAHPMPLWRRLLAGGPEQQKVMTLTTPDHLRLMEIAPGRNDFLFPDAMEHLYRVQTVHGYSALMPRCLFMLSKAERAQHTNQLADYIYQNDAGAPSSSLVKAEIGSKSRFQWLEPSSRTITLQHQSLTTLHLAFGGGPSGTLLWTDTYFPGWSAIVDGQPAARRFVSPCFSAISIPAKVKSLTLIYRPTYLKLGCMIAAASLLAIGGTVMLFPGISKAFRR